MKTIVCLIAVLFLIMFTVDMATAEEKNKEGKIAAQEAIDDLDTLERKAYGGDSEALTSLGLKYYLGDGVAQNFDEAVKLTRVAAEEGLAAAQFNLGMMYRTIDMDKSWWEYGTSITTYIGYLTGNTATSLLGGIAYDISMETHLNSNKDDVEAAKWFTAAANQGHAEAQYYLGVMYENGDGVQKNKVTAQRWFRKAVAQGHALAQEKLD